MHPQNEHSAPDTLAHLDTPETPGDQSEAPRDQEAARHTLRTAGADELPHQPWSHPSAPPDDATLVRFALWRANATVGSASQDEIRAGLRLMSAARAELDSLESALLFVARAEGLTWPAIAGELGVGSPQAAQQRFQRVSQRLGDDAARTGRR